MFIIGNAVIGFQAYKYFTEGANFSNQDLFIFGLAILIAYNLFVLKNTVGKILKKKAGINDENNENDAT